MPAVPAEKDGLQIRLLGELELTAHGRRLPLPQSKKTRALLGYLVLTARPQRRDRLCTLLWDVADDPRAALRWSLSKLRELVDSPAERRLIADREHVSLDLRNAYVDVVELKRLLSGSPGQAPTPTLEVVRTLFRGELLEGLELSDFHAYDAWCIAERKLLRDLHRQVLVTLLDRVGSYPDKALPLVRELVHLDPLDERARAQLLELLHATGRVREAEEQSRVNRRLLSDSMPPSVPVQAASPPEPRREHVQPAPTEEGPFVGRDPERERLRAWLAAPRQGLRVLVIDGDPGVGKSRLIRELTREAAQGGARVASATVPEVRAGWPYAPWRDLLTQLAAGAGDPVTPEGLAPLLSAGAALPQGGGDRDTLFRAITAHLEQCASACGQLILGIDDVHWLDDDSAELLYFVARSLRTARVDALLSARQGELRDQPGITRVLRELRRQGLVEELGLSPLTREQTLELVASTVSDAAVREQLYQQSAGNPLFAIELARECRAGLPPQPSSISRLVRDRLDGLEPGQRDVLCWASILGKSFDSDLLAQVVSLDPEILVETLERLERYGWLALQGSIAHSGSASAFSHDIVRHAVYDQLSEPRRRLMHARVARALAARHDLESAHAAAVAYHATLGGDRGMAVRACLSAGRRCLRLFALSDAQSLARRGLTYALELADPERTALSIDLIQLSIEAHRPASLDEVVPRLVELTARALDLGLVEHARLGFYLRAFLTWEQGHAADARHFCRESERISRSGDLRERVRALGEAACCLARLERDLPEAEAFLLEAEAVAGTEDLEPVVLPLARGQFAIHRGELDSAASALDRARQLAARDGDRLNEFYVLEHRIDLELRRHDYARALQLSDDLVSLGERLRDGSEAPFARAVQALARYATGADSALSFDHGIEALALMDAKQRRAVLLVRAAELEASRSAWPLVRAHAELALRLADIMELPSEAALALALLIESEHALHGKAASEQLDALSAKLSLPISAHARQFAERILSSNAPVQSGQEKPDGTRHRRASLR
ncbi:MAG TPA: AAA family ATPase [Polyangiaceae bacterium]